MTLLKSWAQKNYRWLQLGFATVSLVWAIELILAIVHRKDMIGVISNSLITLVIVVVVNQIVMQKTTNWWRELIMGLGCMWLAFYLVVDYIFEFPPVITGTTVLVVGCFWGLKALVKTPQSAQKIHCPAWLHWVMMLVVTFKGLSVVTFQAWQLATIVEWDNYSWLRAITVLVMLLQLFALWLCIAHGWQVLGWLINAGLVLISLTQALFAVSFLWDYVVILGSSGLVVATAAVGLSWFDSRATFVVVDGQRKETQKNSLQR